MFIYWNKWRSHSSLVIPAEMKLFALLPVFIFGDAMKKSPKGCHTVTDTVEGIVIYIDICGLKSDSHKIRGLFLTKKIFNTNFLLTQNCCISNMIFVQKVC